MSGWWLPYPEFIKNLRRIQHRKEVTKHMTVQDAIVAVEAAETAKANADGLVTNAKDAQSQQQARLDAATSTTTDAIKTQDQAKTDLVARLTDLGKAVADEIATLTGAAA